MSSDDNKVKILRELELSEHILEELEDLLDAYTLWYENEYEEVTADEFACKLEQLYYLIKRLQNEWLEKDYQMRENS